MNGNDIMQEKRRIQWCMGIAAALFIFSIWLGYAVALADPADSQQVIAETFSGFSFVRSANVFLIFLFIFLNNAIKGFLVMVFGTLAGIAPLIFMFSNGELIGLVLGLSTFGPGPLKVLTGIAPHGILEVPAIIMSAGYGLWLGYRAYRKVRYHEPFKAYFSYALHKFTYVILPLLLVAALIETFVTPLVINILR